MNWKGFGRKWPNFKVLSWHLPGGAKPSARIADVWVKLEPGTFQIQKRSVNHSTTMVGPSDILNNISISTDFHYLEESL
jgi:hypothetical protein